MTDLSQTIGHLINGQIVQDAERSQPVFNPSTGEISKHVGLASKATVEEAIATAQAAYPAWRQTPPLKRARVMFRFKQLLEENAEALATVATLAGYKAHRSFYDDQRSNRQGQHMVSVSYKDEVGTSSLSSEVIDYDGYVYCVSVPSKMIVVRRQGTTAICGNTEHAVMMAGGADDEMATYDRLFDTYPTGILSVVSDTWDLWTVLTKHLPALKEKIMSRDGTLVIRPDSGVPEDIICGDPTEPEGSPANKGVVQLLWEEFGGIENEKGYKLLDSHVGVIYGDSITLERAEEILNRLEAMGFVSSTCVFGIGSFTYQFVTRDTYGFAMKATWVEVNGEGRAIFKDPITDKGDKKSARGLLAVRKNDAGELELHQDQTWNQVRHSMLQRVWVNGNFEFKENIRAIRARLGVQS